MWIDRIYRPWWGWRYQNYCASHGKEHLLFQQNGVKSFGFSYDPVGPCRMAQRGILLPPAVLLCPIDGLTDELTLLGTPVVQSPTYAFLHALEHGGPLLETEYIRRYAAGTLDQRWPRNVRYLHPAEFRDWYAARRAQVCADTYEPVRVFRAGEGWYVLNGKHRTALCALLGREVRCDVLDTTSLYAHSLCRMHAKMLRRPAQFRKTLAFLDKIRNDSE